MKKYLFLLIGICIHSTLTFAGEPKIIFEENKNQWPSQVKFQADIPGGKFFLEQNTFTYLYHEDVNWHGNHKNEATGPVKVKFHAYKVNFENSNPAAQLLGNNRHSSHRNYYLGNDPKNWADNVPLFSQVYYKDLYPGIDMQVYNEENNLKYDIIVRAGGKPGDIKLKYEGTDGMRIENGHLHIKTSVYDLIEQKPYAYQVINGVRKQIACSYVLEQNNLNFSVGSYNPSLPLIIDPTLIASAYSGSTADNWGFTATYDAAGNIYMGGTAAAAGYPTTVGAWDATFNGGGSGGNMYPADITLTKFNSNGSVILYSTYYGGSDNEQPHSLIVNNSNELYVLGRTYSSNFPTTSGAYDQTQNGGADMIIGKFNSTGGLFSSTYIGGSGDDGVNINTGFNSYSSLKWNFADDARSEITLDASSNVYVAGCTRSTNFPVSAGAYDATLGGTQDGVVLKINSTLTALSFSTYLGGTADDGAYGLKTDNNNNIYVTGGTTSTDYPATSGVLHQTYQGGFTDGFISVFNSSLSGNAQLLRSTFLGTSAYDQSFFIDIDASGDIYVFGQTQGAYPVSSNVYTNTNSGQFIHKLSGNLTSTSFSTVIGTGNNAVNISPTAFEIDSCGTIYLAGWGRNSILSSNMPSPSGTTGLPVTANAFQNTTDGKDFYIAVLTPGATGLFYATFFGENGGSSADHLDGGTCRFDKNGILYHAACASCGGSNGFPVTNGSTNGSSNCNEAVFKMDVAVSPIAVVPITTPTSGCAPFMVCFNNTGSSASNFIWDFGDGSTSTLPSPCHTYSTAGTYTATLFAIDSIGICGYIDTANTVFTVLNCTGLEELPQSDIAMYPNPTSGLISISYPSNATEISVIDVLGRKTYQTTIQPKNHSTVIDLSSAPSGIYFLQLKTENGIVTRKIIKE